MSHQILDSGMPITLSRFKIVLVADRVLCGPIRTTDNPYKCLRLRLGEVGQIFQRVILGPDSEVGGWTDIMVGWTDASRFQVRTRLLRLIRGEKYWSAVQIFKSGPWDIFCVTANLQLFACARCSCLSQYIDENFCFQY